MGKNNNLQDFMADLADAIREKKGTTDKINPQDFSDEIKSIKTSTSMWTGHVDVEGLKAIGWDDEDIAYFQEHGVNWMEEDDQYHLVSDDNKALYGVLTADNIKEYKDRIVWLPKIESSKYSHDAFLKDCWYMKGMPMIKFKNLITSMNSMFYNCYSLTCIPQIDTQKAENCGSVFRNCYSLQYVPPLNSSGVTQSMQYLFAWCFSLREVNSMSTANTTNASDLYYQCYSLENINGEIDMASQSNLFGYCNNLKSVKVNNAHNNLSFAQSAALSKPSLLYMIEHESATSAITITLHAAAYARLATDPDIVEALSNHPLVSLASA